MIDDLLAMSNMLMKPPQRAECDVWSTKDGVIVLSHDRDLKLMAADQNSHVATTPIREQTWDEIKESVKIITQYNVVRWFYLQCRVSGRIPVSAA